MSETKSGLRPCIMAAAVALALGLAGCGGGGGSNVRPTTPPPPSGSGGGGDQDPPSTLTDAFHIDFDKATRTWSQDIDGKGSLVKEGSGRLILTGHDTYTGGTTISGGVLQIGDGGTKGSIVGDVANNATLAFNRSDDVTFDGLISGSGLVVKQGDGVLTLTAANTYTGGTTVSGGTLVVARGGALGTSDVTLQGVSSYATLQIDENVSFANHVVLGESAMLDNSGAVGGDVDNAVLGAGGGYTYVYNQGAGTIKADDTAVRMTGGGGVGNDNGGLIEGGAFGVVLSHGGSVLNEGPGSTIRSKAGSAVYIDGAEGIVTNRKGGILTSGSTAVHMGYGGQLDNGAGATIATTGTESGDCADGGDCSIFVPTSTDAPHVLSLSNAGTIIGNVQLDASATNSVILWAGGAIHGDLDIGSNADALLGLNGGTNTVQRYSQAVTGTTRFVGHLDKYGDGTWIIDTDALGAAASTWITGGTLQVGDGGDKGAIGQGRVNIESGELVFDRSDDVIFAGDIHGTGSLTQAGTGTLTLTGGNYHTGGTWVTDGTLRIVSDQTGFISGDIVNNATLELRAEARADAVLYESSISGSGRIVQRDALILNGDNSAFTGTTEVDGDLVVGSHAGSEATLGGTLLVGGTLGGYGRVGDVIVDGGVLAPGSSTAFGVEGNFGTLTVDGDLTLSAGGEIHLNLGVPGTRSGTFGRSDNIQVNGDLVLEDAVLKFNTTAGMAPGLYNIINYTGTLTEKSGGLAVDTAVPPTLQRALQYNPGQINLLLSDNPAVAFWAARGTPAFGGSGTWTATSATWTDIDASAVPGPMDMQPSFAIFQGSPGTVTVDTSEGDIRVTGMQFFVDGYTVNGATPADAITLVRDDSGYAPVVNVGDGTHAGKDSTVVINTALNGADGLLKTGEGTLTLSGDNGLSGNVDIAAGTLHMAGGSMHGVGHMAIGGGNDAEALLLVDPGVTLEAAFTLGDGGTLVNHGLLQPTLGTNNDSDASAIRGVGMSTIINEAGGRIRNEEGVAIAMTHGGSLLNQGTGTSVSASQSPNSRHYAVKFWNEEGTVANLDGARIEGARGGVALLAGGTVSNDGTGSSILASASDVGSEGVTIQGNKGKVTNQHGATISGARVGVSLYAGGSVLNDGAGSRISATGDQGGSGWGVLVANATGTVTNTGGGVISGLLGGIVLAQGGAIVNGAGSRIESLDATRGNCDDFNHCAIYVDARYDGSGGATSLSNAGHIQGRVQLDPQAANTVTLTAGGVIDGDLDIGSQAKSTLVLNGAAGTTQRYSDAVSGTTVFQGKLVKSGAGTWVLDAGAPEAMTGVNVKSGTLRAIGMLSGHVDIKSAGVLDGVPTINGKLDNAGVVAVHDGDTGVTGAYRQTADGTLAISLGSKLDVHGKATLDGGTLRVTGADQGYVANTHTSVLVADAGVDGTFDKLVKDAGVVFTSSTIRYGANDVWLDTTGLDVTQAARGEEVDYTPASMGGAVRVQAAFDRINAALATARGRALDKTATMPASAFLTAAGQFQQAPDLRAAQMSLDSLSGQLHAASAAMTLQAIDATGRAFSERVDAIMAGGVEHGVWASNLQRGGDMARNGYADVDYRLNGWLVGGDMPVGADLLAGFAMSQSDGSERLAGRFDRNDSRDTAAMAYLGWVGNRWYAHGRVGLGHYRQRINRMLLLGTQYQGVWTDYTGHYNVAHGESGLHFRVGGLQLTPFASVEFDRVTRGSFAEQGAGGFGLRADAQTLQRWQGGVGLKLARKWQLAGGGSLALDARIERRHTLSANGEVFDASFTGMDAWQPLTGVGLSRRSTVVGLGLTAQPGTHTHVRFGYDYLDGDRGRAGNASARFSMDW